MKNFILAGAAVLTLGSCCFFGEYVEGDGNTVVREYYVGSFDEIELESIGKVVITQGCDESVTAVVEENILDRMNIYDSGDSLVISQDYGVNLHPTREPLFLVTVRDLERVHLSGVGTISGDGLIEADTIRIFIDGAGDVSLDLDASEVISVITGVGKINLTGSAPAADHSITGVGDINAFNLDSNMVEAVISGSGDIDVSCSNLLMATISGTGDVRYKGYPILDVNISGWGSVYRY